MATSLSKPGVIDHSPSDRCDQEGFEHGGPNFRHFEFLKFGSRVEGVRDVHEGPDGFPRRGEVRNAEGMARDFGRSRNQPKAGLRERQDRGGLAPESRDSRVRSVAKSPS